LAAGVLKQFKGIKVNDTFNHAIDKLFSSVNIKKTSKDELLMNAIQPEETNYMCGMEYFETLVSSIRKKIPVSFVHYSYNKKLFKAIIIHPYLMKESNKRWYLVGFSEEHNEVRYFGLDRIYDPVLIDKEFKENNGADLRTLFDHKIGLNTIYDKEVETPEEVTLWVSRTMANYIKSMPLHKSQTHKEHGGYGEILVTLHLVPTYELLAMVLSYGKQLELLKPKWLRNEIEKELERSFGKYKNNKA
jgi:predicted DNA-binding transcriptional regulator YafY